MDQFLECRYQVLEKTVQSPGDISPTKEEGSWSKRQGDGKYSPHGLEPLRIQLKLDGSKKSWAEGNDVLMIPPWTHLDEQGNVKEISIEPQKSSGRRPWLAYYEKPSLTKLPETVFSIRGFTGWNKFKGTQASCLFFVPGYRACAREKSLFFLH